MAVANTSILIPPKAQEAILQYVKSSKELSHQHWNMREQMRKIDLDYMREVDLTTEQSRAKQSNRMGDPTKFQNITVPVILPQVESAVTYQASVFLQGTPIFGVTSNPQTIDEAVQMETVIAEQSTRGGWVAEFIKFFRDGFKYNISACEITWCRQVTASLETDLAFSEKEGKPKELEWEGNSIKRLNLYNTFWDMRVDPVDVYKKGEFAGYIEPMSRIALKQFIQELPDKLIQNIVPAFESTSASMDLYIPELNPDALSTGSQTRNSFNWLSWAALVDANGKDSKIAYKDMYEVTTIYARILPADFGLRVPAPNTPQVWKFIVVNNSVLIYAERQTNAHGFLPILFAQPNDDGLGLQTKSLAANVTPIQQITSAMWTSVIAARRRAISDRGLYDPSRVDPAQINSDNPSAKIPVRPAAYGKPLSEAYFPIPFRDDQSSILLQETQSILQMANIISGQNQARQGQFVKGNKTLHEFDTVMGNANGRDQLCSMLLEAQFFTPVKHILKVNIWQYQGTTALYNRDRQEVVKIDPVALRKAILDFKVTDGLTPADKIVNADALKIAMQMIGTSPVLQAQYNVGPLFTYFLKTQGARITEFEKSQEQIAYESAMAQWNNQMAQISQAFKGMDPAQVQELMKGMPAMPQPQQFGYNPAGKDPLTAAPKVENRQYNISNQITNSGK